MSYNLDSTYHVAYDNDDEIDNIQDMYNKEPNHDDFHSTSPHSPQYCDDTGVMTDNEDESSVEEMYSDFK